MNRPEPSPEMNSLMSKHRLAFLRALGQVTANLRKKLKRSDEVQIHVPPELKGRLPLCFCDEDLSLNLMRPATREQDSGGSPD